MCRRGLHCAPPTMLRGGVSSLWGACVGGGTTGNNNHMVWRMVPCANLPSSTTAIYTCSEITPETLEHGFPIHLRSGFHTSAGQIRHCRSTSDRCLTEVGRCWSQSVRSWPNVTNFG